MAKSLLPRKKAELTKSLSECPSCQTTVFASDPVNNDQDAEPIQSCRGSFGGLRMAALEESPHHTPAANGYITITITTTTKVPATATTPSVPTAAHTK
jgi:hypothetical protein